MHRHRAKHVRLWCSLSAVCILKLVLASHVKVAMQCWGTNEIPGWQGDPRGHSSAVFSESPSKLLEAAAPAVQGRRTLPWQYYPADAGEDPQAASEYSRRSSSISVFTAIHFHWKISGYSHPVKLKPLPEIDLYLCHRLHRNSRQKNKVRLFWEHSFRGSCFPSW